MGTTIAIATTQLVEQHNPRSIMSGFPQDRMGDPMGGGGLPPGGEDSFTNQLLMAAWAQQGDQSLMMMRGAEQQQQQQLLPGSPRSKGLPVGSSPNDVQQWRDRDLSAAGASVLSPSQGALLQQLQQQHLGGSSGPGSDTAGSVQHQSFQDEAQKPVKRGRGRQRKTTGVETAQQRAHRRFYERKKQRMAGLEQQAREMLEEYQQVLAINIELRRKHEALERAVAGRDEHMVLIQALGSLSLDARRRQQQQQHTVAPHLPGVQEQPQQLPGSLQQQAGLQPQQQQAPQHQDVQQQPQTPQDLMPQVEEAGPFGLVQLPQFGSADDDVLPLLADTPAQRASGAGGPGQQPQQRQQQQPQQLELMSWTQLEQVQTGQQQQRQHQQQQQQSWLTGGFMDLLEGPGMSLTRSLSMPARTGGFDTDLIPAGAAHPEGLPGMPGGGGLGVPQVSRSFSSTPTAWMGRSGHLRAAGAAAGAPAAGGADWEFGGAFAAAAAGEDIFAAGQGRQPLLPPGSSRHHSWSGATGASTSSLVPGGLLPQASLSFGVAPAPHHQPRPQVETAGAAAAVGPGSQLPLMAQLPGGLDFEAAVGAAAAGAGAGSGQGSAAGQQPQAWLQHLQAQQQQHEQRQQQQQQQAAAGGDGVVGRQRTSWGATVTTTGPLAGAPPPTQQQLHPPGMPPLPPLAVPGLHPQSQQQQQPGSLQQVLQQRRSGMHHPAPKQVVQQLQQMGDMAFSTDLQQQMAAADMPDDILLFDADMMDMLERLSQQQSVEMLSPLPSIPSALLTGDSLRQAMAADPHMATALAANSPPAAHAAAAGQQQQQQAVHNAAREKANAAAAPVEAAAPAAMAAPAPAAAQPPVAARAAGSPPGSPLTLLEASRQLQSRHVAAGFYPSRTANEMFYVHEIVDWYKAKLQQLQQLLPYVDRPVPDVSCAVSLVQTMEEIIDGVRKFGTRNRIGVWELKLINLETGDFQEAPPSHWAMVAERIQLPQHMRESAIACYTLYLEYVEKVKADRQAVLQDFQLLEQHLEAAAGAGSGGSSQQQQQTQAAGAAPPSLQFRMDGYEQYQHLIERLQLSLKREHMVANMLSYSLSQIASHTQMAKGMLACWPYWPDGPSVLSFWLAEDQAKAHAAASLAAGVAGVAGAAAGL